MSRLRAKTMGKFQASELSKVRMAEAISEKLISLARPRVSALKAQMNKPAAMPKVEKETARLLVAGSIWKSRQRSERTGWNRYNWAKTESPERKMQLRIRLKRTEPISALGWCIFKLWIRSMVYSFFYGISGMADSLQRVPLPTLPIYK